MRAIFLLALLACSDSSTVNLTFGDRTRVPVAFRCKDAAGRFLPSRAVTARQFKVAVLVDFYALNGLPTCRLGDIASWCDDQSHNCRILDKPARVCFDRERTLGPTDDAVHAMNDVLTELDGMMVTTDAPHEPVLVRVVGTAQSCAELAGNAPYDPAKLTGCAISCPVQLDSVSGDVLLDLPTLSDQCEAGVIACAAAQFRQ